MDGKDEGCAIGNERIKSLDPMSAERRTLEERTQMTDLERLRHSASYVLAKAVLKIWAADYSAAQECYSGIPIKG